MFLVKMLELGWLTREDLENRALGGGPIPSAADRDLRVNDKDGAGLDCRIFCNRVLSVSGMFDFAAYTNATKIKLDAQTPPHVLADLIEESGLSISVLCLHAQVLDQEVAADPLLRHIAEG